LTTTVVDDTPTNEAEAVVALRRAQNADPQRRVFYAMRYDGGAWSIVFHEPGS